MTNQLHYPLLERVNMPEDLRQLNIDEMLVLAQEIRQFMIQSVAKTGGHLSAGLGTVELTIALHYVFNTPFDKLVWDVGHQSYPHKILTGRREKMATLRQKGGLSGFNKRSESEFDSFGVGHSSTSISAALGMAIANEKYGKDNHAIAIIGDGSMTAGMAFEALNHAGALDANLLVVLNDNDMSISENVGGLSKYFARVLAGKLYSTVREGSKTLLERMPSVWELARRTEEHVKGMVVPGTLFEELGFNYIGPIDGHDLPKLIRTFNNLRNLKGPRFLHVVTQKGKGYTPAENNPTSYHGVPKFNPDTGEKTKETTNGPTYTEVFGKWLCDTARKDRRLIAITPAMREGSGMVEFSEQFSDRYLDVGIAEQHSVTLAAGLACEGMKPVVAIYSTFLQRAYDQLIHDVALQNLPILFAIDRAGIVGADGPTHAGAYDISFLRCIPNMLIMAPSDENECRRMLDTGFMHDGPSAVRYPRGSGPGTPVDNTQSPLAIGKARVITNGKQIAILAFGSMLQAALEAGRQLNASVVDMRFIKPLDEKTVCQMANDHKILITVEENSLLGGAGSSINELLAAKNIKCSIINLGLPDKVTDQGSREQLLSEYGLDAPGIVAAVTSHPEFTALDTTSGRPINHE